jgi:cytosine/adenosine deaminase-related metal-dependent hydrolase
MVFKNARVVTCTAAGAIVDGDVAVADGRIVKIGTGLMGDEEVHLSGRWLLPGFVQTHVHLVQTLFRGLADDLALMEWLRTRIWPLERAHDVDSVRISAELGIDELLSSGTTAVLDMATVHHTDAVFDAADRLGIRLACGKAQMDRDNEAGLGEALDTSVRSACELADRWHGRAEGRLRYAFAPRFVPSCTEGLLVASAREARRRGCMLHTHASENRDEVELVRQLTGRDNVSYLHDIGFTGPDVGLAHCIHLTAAEESLLARTGTRLLHCPSSNLKLASGIARIPELVAMGVHISLGADGAPCNNRLDAFAEMRLAALVQKVRLGATAMPALTVLRMMTAHGAETLGIDAGEIAPGKLADLVVIDPDRQWTGGDPHAAIVYQMDARSVTDVYVGGRQVVREARTVGLERARLAREATHALRRVADRASVALPASASA